MWSRAIVLLALCGCYAPAYRDCEITCSGGACPAGLECRDNVCRAPDVTASCNEVFGDARMSEPDADDPNADDDGDRIKNSDDNCRAVINTDQHDEDSDTLGDVCDPCPPYRTYIANGAATDANVDSDGDGVGDGCDPNPTLGGERIALFEGFRAQPTNATSTPASAIWSFENDSATAKGTNDRSRLLFTVGLAASSTHYLSTRVEITSFSSTNTAIAGVVDSVEDTTERGGACVGGVHTTPQPSVILLNSSAMGDVHVSSTPGAATGGPFEIKLVRRVPGTAFRCTHQQLMTEGSIPVGTISHPLGLHTRGVTAKYDWFLVVEGPP